MTRDTNSKTSDFPVRVYDSPGRKKNLIQETFRSLIHEFPAAHSLGFLFAERNIKAKYRQSIFGMFWALLPPLATAFIWIVLNKASVVKMQSPGVPYPLFVIIGIMLWSSFSNAVVMPLQTMQGNRNILTKLNFPRESLIISSFYESLFSTILSLVIITVAMLYFKVPLTTKALLFIPGTFLLLMLGMSIGLLLLPVSMLYKDIQFGLPILLQFGMYLTPVVYALPPAQGVGKLILLNPVTPVLSNTRGWLLGMDAAFSFQLLGIVAVSTVILLIMGILLQRATMQILIERMGS